MNKDFSRIITLLRKEKKLSQKQVATDLGVSQALLSHYEKGIRECGLEFLSKIADYYDVSTDYLLGRTPHRYSDISDISNDSTNANRDKATLIISKKILQNTQELIFDYLYKIDNRKLSKNVVNYLMVSTYNMFRKIYSANRKNPQDMFAIHNEVYSGFSTAALEVLSTRVSSATDPNCENDFLKKCGELEISPDTIATEYPQLASSVFNLIQHAETNMKFKK
ncbi:MAG: helix-turn-helix transcriptional regulator [Ruminococcus sp.]|nr:helix-turn-helix transcriptional regulator [Ruminococcus sp.]